MQGKTYRIWREGAADEIGGVRATVNGAPLHHVQYHSEGFEFGYGGSGPADLALSILADYFGEKPTRDQLYRGDCKCWRLHQPFKWTFIAGPDRNELTITDAEIAAWLHVQKVQA